MGKQENLVQLLILETSGLDLNGITSVKLEEQIKEMKIMVVKDDEIRSRSSSSIVKISKPYKRQQLEMYNMAFNTTGENVRELLITYAPNFNNAFKAIKDRYDEKDSS